MIQLVLLVSLISVAPLQARVPNNQHGICYWSCVDSVLGTDLVSTVLLTGIGRDDGADEKAIDVMFEAFEIRKLTALTTAGAESQVESNIPVIAIMQPWTTTETCHAIVMLDVRTVRTSRKSYQKQLIYYDPNYPKQNRIMSWSAFAAKYRVGHILEKK
jgi:hypothetical protein